MSIAKTYLVTAITDGMVELIAASGHLDLDMLWHNGAPDSGDKGVLGMMAMSILSETWLAKIVIIASSAVKELLLGKFCNC